MIFKPKKRENPYAQIDKSAINDTRLTWKAKGILVYLLSKPEDWTVNIKDIVNHANDGRDAVYNGIKELIAAGYILRVLLQSQRGRFKGYEYHVYEIPQAQESHIKEDCTVYGKTAYGKSDTTNNEVTDIKSSSLTLPVSEEDCKKNNGKASKYPILPMPFNNLMNSEAEKIYKKCVRKGVDYHIHGAAAAKKYASIAVLRPCGLLLQLLDDRSWLDGLAAAQEATKRREAQRVKKQEQASAENNERIKAALEAVSLDQAYILLSADMQDAVRQKAISNLPYNLRDNSLAVKMAIREAVKNAEFVGTV